MFIRVVILAFFVASSAAALRSEPAAAPKDPPPIFIGDRPSPEDLQDLRQLTHRIAGIDQILGVRGYHVYWEIDDTQLFDIYVRTAPEQPRLRRLAKITFYPRTLLARRPSADPLLGERWGAYPQEYQLVLQVSPAEIDWKTVKKVDGDLIPIVLTGDAPDAALIAAVDFVRNNPEIHERLADDTKNPGAYPAARLQSLTVFSPNIAELTFRTGDETGVTASLEKKADQWTLHRLANWTPKIPR